MQLLQELPCKYARLLQRSSLFSISPPALLQMLSRATAATARHRDFGVTDEALDFQDISQTLEAVKLVSKALPTAQRGSIHEHTAHCRLFIGSEYHYLVLLLGFVGDTGMKKTHLLYEIIEHPVHVFCSSCFQCPERCLRLFNGPSCWWFSWCRLREISNQEPCWPWSLFLCDWTASELFAKSHLLHQSFILRLESVGLLDVASLGAFASFQDLSRFKTQRPVRLAFAASISRPDCR